MRALGDSDPRRVGAYRVLAGLDADEMGLVLLGGAPDGRLAAIKLVSTRLTVDDGFAQRFGFGVAAQRRVAGGHTAPVVDVGALDGAPWLALEYVPGVSVRQMIDRGVLLGEDAVLRLAAGLVGALGELHRAGLVHRDLTPVNVRLTEGGVRVFDFGVARAVDHDVSHVVGAAEFMSPEQAGGRPVTPASDVFSLGALLHLVVTGRSLFVGPTRTETLAHVVQAQVELSAALPTRIRRLLAACLAKEPGQRPTLDQLQAMIGPIPPVAQPWPPLVQSMIVEDRAEAGRVLGNASGVFDASTRPVVRPRRRPSRRRWKPDMWAVVSAGAVLVTLVFAIVMFNVLTPDRPLEASPKGTSSTTTTAVTTTTTTTTTTQQAPYGEVTGLAEKCVDVAGAKSDNGTAIQLHECNGTDAQQWEFLPDGTVQALGKCLDVAGGDTNDGAKVQLYDCNGTGAQQWVATPEGWIINVAADKCLDVPASKSDDGTQLVIWTCHGEDNQVWAPPA